MRDPFFNDGQVTLYLGHVLEVLREMPAESVQAVITSPPYWALRSYSTAPQVWGGDPNHGHEWEASPPPNVPQRGNRAGDFSTSSLTNPARQDSIVREHGGLLNTGNGTPESRAGRFDALAEQRKPEAGNQCPCGAWRGELGHEPTPSLFVDHLVEIFREVRRVLKPDGVCFVNLGDSYAGGAGGRGDSGNAIDGKPTTLKHDGERIKRDLSGGMKAKSLVLIPERFAIAMQEPYEHHAIADVANRAWLAGLIDGEGCIFSQIQQPRNAHAVGLQVHMADREAIEKAIAVTGRGKLMLDQMAPSAGPRRPSQQWRVNGDAALDVLADIYPYLTVKRKQALVVWNMLKLRDGLPKGRVVPRENQAKRLALHDVLRSLNQRKTVEIPSWCVEPTVRVDPGWVVRSRIAWCKRAPMPESVKDRPTNAWEHIWMMTKSERYFWDQEAVREAVTGGAHVKPGDYRGPTVKSLEDRSDGVRNNRTFKAGMVALGPSRGRNMWSYWLLSPDPEPMAHFATFPREIPRRCIAAATSDKGECPQCGKSWVRVVETHRNGKDWNANSRDGGDRLKVGQSASDGMPATYRPPTTTGWAPQCDHNLPPIASTVLDPFCGSGTTNLVARSMLRRSIGIDLSEQYLREIALKKNNQMALMPAVER